MRRYKLLQDCKIPRMDLHFKSGEVKTSLEWLNIFYPVELPSYYNKSESDRYCNEYPSWFAAIPSFPTKEDMADEMLLTLADNFFSDQRHKVVKNLMLNMAEKHEKSIIEQLIEKIGFSNHVKNHTYNDPNGRALKSEIIETLRNFKSA